MQQPKWMFRRKWAVGHGRDGFLVMVRDEWLPALIVDRVVGGVLAALGHPCCGKGIGRLPSEALGMFWFRVLNLPCGLYRFSRPVLDVRLTPDQAFTLAPHLRDEASITVDGVDEWGGEWGGGVLVRDEVSGPVTAVSS